MGQNGYLCCRVPVVGPDVDGLVDAALLQHRIARRLPVTETTRTPVGRDTPE